MEMEQPRIIYICPGCGSQYNEYLDKCPECDSAHMEELEVEDGTAM